MSGYGDCEHRISVLERELALANQRLAALVRAQLRQNSYLDAATIAYLRASVSGELQALAVEAHQSISPESHS